MKRVDILVVDHDANVCALLRRSLAPGSNVVWASDSTIALQRLAAQTFDAIVADFDSTGSDYLHLVRSVRESTDHTAVVFVTARGSIPEAVRAMAMGADDYLTKPFDAETVTLALERALERRRAARRGLRLDSSPPAIVGGSRTIGELRNRLERAARSDEHVLLIGESGTGKDLVARSIHARSGRSEGPFVLHAARTSSERQLELDLVHCCQGVLYIDEIFEMQSETQAWLARQLIAPGCTDEPRSGIARVIASTSVDLTPAVNRGLFRADLEAELGAMRLEVSPLRHRREDIPQLVTAFLARQSSISGAPARAISAEALDALVAHDWPGNVRQLEAVLVRAVAVATGSHIAIGDLPVPLRTPVMECDPCPLTSLTYREVLGLGDETATHAYLTGLLVAVGGNVTHAAERARVERETFYRLLKRRGIRPQDFRTH